MLVHYHVEKLKQVIGDFYALTGINVSVLDTEFHMLARCPEEQNSFCALIHQTPVGFSRCLASDTALLRSCVERRQPVTHRCHAGLIDTAVPIFSGELLLGFILFGQVCETEGDRLPFTAVSSRVADLGADVDALRTAYDKLMFFDRQTIRCASELVSMLTRYIWLEQMIRADGKSPLEQITDYIDTHLTETITVPALCQRFHLSKNTLYRHFREGLRCTVGEYVTRRRLALAEQLLKTTELPIYRICEQAGIENYHYFCRLFKKEVGQTPLRFRKLHRTDNTLHLPSEGAIKRKKGHTHV